MKQYLNYEKMYQDFNINKLKQPDIYLGPEKFAESIRICRLEEKSSISYANATSNKKGI